jgi:deoxyadenosine/deoxycytidine kinase
MHIGIIGCIGVGKSRLTSALTDRLGFRAYYEPVKENPYLDDYYQDPKRYACIMQFFMLTARFRQHLEIQDLVSRGVGVVQDQVIYGDILYGRLTHDFGYMDDRDYETYRAHFEALRPMLRLPDVVIYLDADLKTLQARIKERGRSSEKAIAPDYLERLSKLFSDWADEVAGRTKVIRLDWNAYQPIDEVVAQVEKALDIQLRLPVVAKSPAI